MISPLLSIAVIVVLTFLFLLDQVLLVLFGTLYFGDHVSFINGMGIFIVLAAGFK